MLFLILPVVLYSLGHPQEFCPDIITHFTHLYASGSDSDFLPYCLIAVSLTAA